MYSKKLGTNELIDYHFAIIVDINCCMKNMAERSFHVCWVAYGLDNEWQSIQSTYGEYII